jgi:hypothetical protein
MVVFRRRMETNAVEQATKFLNRTTGTQKTQGSTVISPCFAVNPVSPWFKKKSLFQISHQVLAYLFSGLLFAV